MIVVAVWWSLGQSNVVREHGGREGRGKGGGPSRDEGKKGRMVQFVAVTLAGATMESLRSVLRVTLEGHLTPLTSAPNRGRTRARVQGIAVTEFSGLLSYQPSCLLRSPSMRGALERSMAASRLHRSSPCDWARMPSLSFRKGRLCGSTARAD
jgi:hypothetical protein